MSSYFLYSDVGLTPEEARALLDLAGHGFNEGLSLTQSYSKDPERLLKPLKARIQDGTLSAEQGDYLIACTKISQLSERSFKPFENPVKLNPAHGFFESHPSFGCMSQKSITAQPSYFVGSPSLSSHVIGLEFSYASLAVDDHFRVGVGDLREETHLYEADLAEEQFAHVIRNASAGTPCYLSRNKGNLTDRPPRLIESVCIAEQVKAEADAIIAPLRAACADLKAHLNSDIKISTKADYALIRRKLDQVGEILAGIEKPLNDLLARAAGEIAEASLGQMRNDLQETILALGIDEGTLMALTHNE